ncbi:MAG: hypothetical protein AAF340_14490 [Pseudomonadota bacterium]
MANGPTYDFSAAFAQMTGLLEDAAVSASAGQSGGLDQNTRLHLVTELEQHIGKANRLLKEIKAAL